LLLGGIPLGELEHGVTPCYPVWMTSGRDIGAALGVDEKTVRRDAAANAAADPGTPSPATETAANAAPEPDEDELAEEPDRSR
jgi:hypothetical protein